MTRAFLLLLFFLSAGCNAQLATVLASEDGGDGGPSQGGSDGGASSAVQTKACMAAGGVCLPADTTAPPNRQRSSEPCDGTDVCWVLATGPGGKNCATDQDCNDNPVMSSLMGRCFHGMCMCNAPYHVQPNGKCGTAQPPDCTNGGGTCRQMPAECGAGELESDLGSNMSCGDFVPAVCCYQASLCNTTVDFVCCGAALDPYEPTCVNGWRTCDGPGPTPMLRKPTCGP